MKRSRARSCPSVYKTSKKTRNWDETAKEAERLLDSLRSSDETSDKPDALVPETREQRIQSAGKKVKTLTEILKLLEALVENLAVGDTLSLEEAEKSVKRKKYQKSSPGNNNHKRKKRTNLTRNLEVTVHTRCPICGKTKHEKTITGELINE